MISKQIKTLVVAASVLVAARPSPVLSEVELENGTVRVLVFVGALPAQAVKLDMSGVEAVTNENGAAVFSLPPGEHLLVAGTGAQAEVKVNVVGGAEAEVLLSLDQSGNLVKADLESGTVVVPTTEPVLSKTATLGRVKGVIRSTAGKEVEGAQVFVRGTDTEARTTSDGRFTLELPIGGHDIVVIHQNYITETVGVTVEESDVTVVEFELEEASAQLEAFVVTAPHIEGGVAALVAERRQSSSVDDVIGVEEMSRSGDSDAAGALRRVTGITVVGGQFVYVRGMGERYSATLLNSQSVPSPEPERRVIPLDLFSTDVLESVVIQKTPAPDTPGEFGGGIVQLRTKSFPKERLLKVSASTGVASTASFQKRPSYRGGSLDFLGFDDGTRSLPAEIEAGSPLKEGNLFEEGFTRSELAELGRLLPNNYNVTQETVPMNLGLGATYGDRFKLGKMPAGFLASISYGNRHTFRAEEFKRFIASQTAEGGLEINNDFNIEQANQQIAGSAIFVAGAELSKGHSVKGTTLILRVTDDQTSVVTGRSDDLGQNIEQSRLWFVERQLLTQQLEGHHEFGKENVFDWRYSFSLATRDQPDRREYFYADESVGDEPPDFQISGRPNGNQRVYSDLSDRIHDAGVDFERSLPLWKGLSSKVKVGAAFTDRKRDFSLLRLSLRPPNILSSDDRSLTPEEIWSRENINANGGWILEDSTQPTDAYRATQQIQAGYAMAKVPLHERLLVSGGARVERSVQEVTTFSQFSPEDAPRVARLDNIDILPSLTAKLNITDKLVLRGSYGKTVSRPDMRELSESQFRDVVTARRFVGNPNLKRGTIHNFDTRMEYYFSGDEVASVSAFYKSFSDPIEQIDRGGVDRSISWDNADSAKNIGVELELRRRFGFVHGALDPLFASVNLAFIKSEVSLGEGSSGVSTSKERPLQGQSPYVVNLQAGYDDSEGSGVTAVVLYNVFGPRIRDVGRLGTPDVFEEPIHTVDAVYSQVFEGGWQLKLQGKNLIDQTQIFSQGNRTPRRYRNGREFSLSMSWSH